MKAKLLKLDLPENIVDEILDIFDTYQQTLKQYSKPKGRIALQDNMKDIESLSKKLQKRLDKLSGFEKQILNAHLSLKIFELKTGLIRLDFSCQQLGKTKTRFSKREPFLITLTRELRELLEARDISVKKYRNNIVCRVLDILFNESEDSERSFNLLRQSFKP
jgi:hypothetical protein